MTDKAAAALVELLRIRKLSVERLCGLERYGIYQDRIESPRDPERILASFDGAHGKLKL